MTNKLVVIINSLKVPKIKKILLYEIKFLVPNYSCLQNPWLGSYSPQIPVLSVLCPQLNLLNTPPPTNKIPGYATVREGITVARYCCGTHCSWPKINDRICSGCFSLVLSAFCIILELSVPDMPSRLYSLSWRIFSRAPINPKSCPIRCTGC